MRTADCWYTAKISSSITCGTQLTASASSTSAAETNSRKRCHWAWKLRRVTRGAELIIEIRFAPVSWDPACDAIL
jgi:hypothetical protein